MNIPASIIQNSIEVTEPLVLWPDKNAKTENAETKT